MNGKRLIISITGLALLGMLAAALGYGTRLIGIGTAYKAKMLCSEVFVAARRPDEVLVDLEIDDLEALRIIKPSIDKQTGTASASFLGMVTRSARYRGNTGCALTFGTGTVTDRDVTWDAHGADTPVYRELPTTDPGPPLVAVLDEAFSEPDPARLRRTRAVVVVQDGRVVAEHYAPGFGPRTPFPGWSMAKSILNALVGIMVREGRLAPDTPLSAPEWHAPDDPRATLTLDHLLHMNSGLAFDEDMNNPVSDVTRMLLGEPDAAAFAAAKGLQAKPGTRWQYSSGSSNIISRALRKLMDDDAYRRFPRRALFHRLGMSSAVLETDASGTFVASSFMYATARDWARFGMLYVDDGVWEGDRILPEGWLDYSRTPATTGAGKAYGAHFWLSIPWEYNQSRTTLPPDTLHAIGHEGQFVTIVPSHGAVIVRLGKTRYAHAWDHGIFINAVLSALRSERDDPIDQAFY